MYGCTKRHRLLTATVLLSALITPALASAQLPTFQMYAPLGNENKFAEGAANGTAPMQPASGSNTAGANAITFTLRPHCDSDLYRETFKKTDSTTAPTPDASCPVFDVKDPQTLQTTLLKNGDPLDLDLLITNPTNQPIKRFRAWLAYDPTALEGEMIEISPTFPTPTPGEADFSTTDGYIKLSGTADVPPTATSIRVAHIRLHTLPTAHGDSPVTFYDATGTPGSHTGIFTMNGTQETNVATTTPTSIIVRGESNGNVPSSFTGVTVPASATSSADAVMQQSSLPASEPSTPSASNQPQSNVFSLLQVQHLKVTTDGSSVFLAWDALPSNDLVGYNLYYGTISGQYLQKRSVDKNTTNITIRALPVGVTYYFAIRGVNASNQETDFSQEVGISVGNPATSTSPLTASAINTAPKTPTSNGTISGQTGTSSSLLLFLAISAVIGTGLAFRRQLSARA